MKTCPYCGAERSLTEFRAGVRKCKLCERADRSEREKNPAVKAKKAAYRAAYREANKEKEAATDAEYYRNNKEKIAVRKAPYLAEYYQAHKSEFMRRSRERGRRVTMRVWDHERFQLEAFYANRPEGHHVDHIIPLVHPLVSGLHVLANLQYLPAFENDSKGNRFDGC